MLKLKEQSSLNIDSSHNDEVRNSPFARLGVSPASVVSETTLRHHLKSKYFISKLNDIKRLESEIALVEKMDSVQYDEYSQRYCPLLKTKHELLNNDFFWIRHYWQQIMSVYGERNG